MPHTKIINKSNPSKPQSTSEIGSHTVVNNNDQINNIIEESNGHFAAIIQSSDDAIISKTLDGIITSWNNSAERIFGYTAQEMIGTHITRIVPFDRLDEEPRILNRLKRGERIDHFETKRITKDGKLLDISLCISPVKNSKGVIIGASKIARDITAQKRAEQLIRESEERIRESEERLRLAVEIAELGMWDLDLSTGLTTTSPEHQKILGYPKTEQWSKARFLEMVHPADRSMVEQAIQAALKTGKISYEARIISTGNTERWIRVNGTTIYDKKITLFDCLEQYWILPTKRKPKMNSKKWCSPVPVNFWPRMNSSKNQIMNWSNLLISPVMTCRNRCVKFKRLPTWLKSIFRKVRLLRNILIK